ncbi:unnamed protein product [Acanthoscelides obtectus]|uniref:Uncharacterized protein n=1 Tax=Acanthoscelides obtectus TaxID=200917 RepID=A0A9P0KCQ2_ACAOB|nr:unnamed protein product [Acanthoscelides obtectus]CAK1669290.1 hypothetical protein AOBTE_LOCUS26931 [Acanthoscelides obtectus]
MFKVTLQGHSKTQGHTSRSLGNKVAFQGYTSRSRFKVGTEGQLSRSFGTEGRRSRASQNIQTLSTILVYGGSADPMLGDNKHTEKVVHSLHIRRQKRCRTIGLYGQFLS